MDELEFILDKLGEELDDACEYAKKAIFWKDKEKDVANLFYKLGEQELEHYAALNGHFMEAAEKMRSSYPDYAHKAIIVYDWAQKKNMEKMERVKVLLNQYGK